MTYDITRRLVEAIAELAAQRGIARQQLWLQLNVAPGLADRFAKGEELASLELLTRAIQALGLSPNWLETGRGTVYVATKAPENAPALPTETTTPGSPYVAISGAAMARFMELVDVLCEDFKFGEREGLLDYLLKDKTISSYKVLQGQVTEAEWTAVLQKLQIRKSWLDTGQGDAWL